MRENCTYSLSGGRWLARKCASSDPTLTKRSNAGRGGPQEIVEGRPLTKENAEEPNPHRTPSRESGPSGLDRVREAAKGDPKMRFTALLHHVNIDRLGSSYFNLKRQAAAGVDEVTWQEYGDGLEERLVDLHGRIHGGAYQAKPSRRVWIAKDDGRQRPLGIAALEDKIAQAAVVQVLNQIWEEDFLNFSYGSGRGEASTMRWMRSTSGSPARRWTMSWTWTSGHFSTRSSRAIWKSSCGIGSEMNGSSA